MSHRLSEDAAEKRQPTTFRSAVVTRSTGEPVAIAMHVTFAKEQGLILTIALEAMPSILTQLREVVADAATLKDD